MNTSRISGVAEIVGEPRLKFGSCRRGQSRFSASNSARLVGWARRKISR
jgi:hypothetical protein